jgi:hypothetical protein
MLAARALMAAANQGGLDEDLMDWQVPVDVFMTPINHVGFPNSNYTMDFDLLYAAKRYSSGAQNDYIEWDISLAAGTWTFELIGLINTASGIVNVQLDGSSVGTIDMYNSAEIKVYGQRVAGISVSASGKKRLKLLMATKNASSTNYYLQLEHIQFKRTA